MPRTGLKISTQRSHFLLKTGANSLFPRPTKSRCFVQRRYRNREHLRSVAKQPCLVCGRKPSDPHHLRYLQPRALGRKASDEFAVPLCRSHHRAVHRAGDERAWWKAAGIDPVNAARKLWKRTRMDEARIRPRRTTQGADSDRASKSHDVDSKAPA